MAIDLANYVGREQAGVKHHFLHEYVKSLVFKVSGGWSEFAYVDGFSGPWKDQGEDFQDTSFGIALEAMKAAKLEWKRIKNRDISMTAILVEKNQAAYTRLQAVRAMYPEINVVTLNGDFVGLVPTIMQTIPERAFSFVLMDPKGWAIDMDKVAPLLARRNSEVVFNFIFDFVNRFAKWQNPAIQASLDRLMPGTNWKDRLGAVRSDLGQASEQRREVLVSSIIEVIGRLGGYPYVMETPVLFPARDRTFYSLIYGTRSAKGVEVFRECQHKALVAQDKMREALAAQKREEALGMGDLFGGAISGNEFAGRWMVEQEIGARAEIVREIPAAPGSVRYGEVWPKVMSRWGVKKTRMGRIVAEMRGEGALRFLDWAPRSRVPDDSYRVTR